MNICSNIEYTDVDKVVLVIKQLVDGTSDSKYLASFNYIEFL
jgi:hypothetical protein